MEYNDWYLPSRSELHEMFSTIGGNGDPDSNIGGFQHTERYWSSTESDKNPAYFGTIVKFDTGYTGNYYKANGSPYVRPIRTAISYPTGLSVGDLYEGGMIFYLGLNLYTSDDTSVCLIAALEDLGHFMWGCLGSNLNVDETTIGSGYQNTLDIVAGCSETPIAASEALAYSVVEEETATSILDQGPISLEGEAPYYGPFTEESFIYIPVVAHVFLDTAVTSSCAPETHLYNDTGISKGRATIQGAIDSLNDSLDEAAYLDDPYHGIMLPYRFKLVNKIPSDFVYPVYGNLLNSDKRMRDLQAAGGSDLFQNISEQSRYSLDLSESNVTASSEYLDCGDAGAMLFYNWEIWKQKDKIAGIHQLQDESIGAGATGHKFNNPFPTLPVLNLIIPPWSYRADGLHTPCSNNFGINFGGSPGSAAWTQTSHYITPSYGGIIAEGSLTVRPTFEIWLNPEVNQASSVNIRNVMHEFGHVLGAAHSHVYMSLDRTIFSAPQQIAYSPRFEYLEDISVSNPEGTSVYMEDDWDNDWSIFTEFIYGIPDSLGIFDDAIPIADSAHLVLTEYEGQFMDTAYIIDVIENVTGLSESNFKSKLLKRLKVMEIILRAPIFWGGSYWEDGTGTLFNVINPAEESGERKGPQITMHAPFCKTDADGNATNEIDFGWAINLGFLDNSKPVYPDNTKIRDMFSEAYCPCLHLSQTYGESSYNFIDNASGVPKLTTEFLNISTKLLKLYIAEVNQLKLFSDKAFKSTQNIKNREGFEYLYSSLFTCTGLFTGLSSWANVPQKYIVPQGIFNASDDGTVRDILQKSPLNGGLSSRILGELQTLDPELGVVTTFQGAEMAILYTLGSTDSSSTFYNPFKVSDPETFMQAVRGDDKSTEYQDMSTIYGPINVNMQEETIWYNFIKCFVFDAPSTAASLFDFTIVELPSNTASYINRDVFGQDYLREFDALIKEDIGHLRAMVELGQTVGLKEDYASTTSSKYSEMNNFIQDVEDFVEDYTFYGPGIVMEDLQEIGDVHDSVENGIIFHYNEDDPNDPYYLVVGRDFTAECIWGLDGAVATTSSTTSFLEGWDGYTDMGFPIDIQLGAGIANTQAILDMGEPPEGSMLLALELYNSVLGEEDDNQWYVPSRSSLQYIFETLGPIEGWGVSTPTPGYTSGETGVFWSSTDKSTNKAEIYHSSFPEGAQEHPLFEAALEENNNAINGAVMTSVNTLLEDGMSLVTAGNIASNNVYARVVQTRTSTADVLFIKKVPRIYYYSDTDAEHTDILASMLGCTDVEACNYDETAMVSFGCTYPEPHRNCAGDCINDADGDNICDEADSCVGSIDICGNCQEIEQSELDYVPQACFPTPRIPQEFCVKDYLSDGEQVFLCSNNAEMPTNIDGGSVVPFQLGFDSTTNQLNSLYSLGYSHNSYALRNWDIGIFIEQYPSIEFVDSQGSALVTTANYDIPVVLGFQAYNDDLRDDYISLRAATFNCVENPYQAPSSTNNYAGGGGCIAVHNPATCVYGTVSTTNDCALNVEIPLEDILSTYGLDSDAVFNNVTCVGTSDYVVLQAQARSNTVFTQDGNEYSGPVTYQSNSGLYSGDSGATGSQLYTRNQLLRDGVLAITSIDKKVAEFQKIKQKINKICSFTDCK